MTNSDEQQFAMSKEEIEEREHFRKVLAAFKAYRHDSKDRLAKSHMNLKKIPLEHQRILNKIGFQEELSTLDSCVELNHKILQDIIADASSMFDNSTSASREEVIASQKIEGKNGAMILG